jgi:hypothetical protein
MLTKFWLENLKGSDNVADVGVDRRILLEWSLRWEGVGWILLARVRDQFRALVNTVMNLRVL